METRNSESCISEHKINVYLPKKKTTIGTCDFCIEDFLEILKNRAKNTKEGKTFLQLPTVSIGDYEVGLFIGQGAPAMVAGEVIRFENLQGSLSIRIAVCVKWDEHKSDGLKLTLKMAGDCGNQTFEKECELFTKTEQTEPWEIQMPKNINHLINAMINTGNKKLKMTLELKEEEIVTRQNEWIITKNR